MNGLVPIALGLLVVLAIMPSLVSDTFARKSTLKTTGSPLPPEAGKPPYPVCFQFKTETAKDTSYFFSNKCNSADPTTVDYEAVSQDYWYYKLNKMQLPITITYYAKDWATSNNPMYVSEFTIQIPKP